MPAKTLFLERMDALARSTSIEAVTNKPLTDHAHNSVARMLRNGLAVVGFAALEDFIKSRTSEVLAEVGRTAVPFTELPERLRNATTFEVVSALQYQLSISDKAERLAYIQDHAAKIASTATSAYELSPHAFGFSQANLKDETIKDILKGFMIDDPWQEISKVGARIGLNAVPLNEVFKAAAIRRHRAAHVARVDVPQTDLIQFVRDAYAIAIGFDALLSAASQRIRLRDHEYLAGRRRVNNSSFKVRIVREESNRWKEFVEGRSRALKASPEATAAIDAARGRAQAHSDLLVVLRSGGEVQGWDTY